MRMRFLGLVAVMASLVSACKSDGTTAPSPLPVLGLSATPTGSTTMTISFAGRAGESYDIERAEGATGTFASITVLAAAAADGTLQYKDTGLKVSTLYRYRVTTVKNSVRSSPSAEATATTLAFGSASAVINTDITVNRTLYADTAYTLSGFVHVANGATLTIQPGTTIKDRKSTRLNSSH